MYPKHDLKKIKDLIVAGKVEYFKGTLVEAFDDLGWDKCTVVKAILSLKDSQHRNREALNKFSGGHVIDVYKGYYKKDDFYAHLHIEFKKWDGYKAKINIAMVSCHGWRE